ncbi:hypothetical protein ZEAMMB73_Zm00001d032590 [Zea mays]|uniref:Uncharacterized protein n=1 Tax=Zea mays TaxID=4577 RepID=A0A1D6KRY9_MAIZE|nr:hypothetical protein ZEAMMB73_Zm00001d032590 [Zea mays]ONM05460.1 hypothetical protein ZEAMMB73_Zm00001d032590 [Zea mays]ONM05461.1 hypothetical protein ZEAMMB73_Zm00001d032590 [Zea mays]
MIFPARRDEIWFDVGVPVPEVSTGYFVGRDHIFGPDPSSEQCSTLDCNRRTRVRHSTSRYPYGWVVEPDGTTYHKIDPAQCRGDWRLNLEVLLKDVTLIQRVKVIMRCVCCIFIPRDINVICRWFVPVNIAITFMIGGTLGWIPCSILKPPQHFRGLIMAFCSASVTITKDDIKVFVTVPSKSSTEFPNAAWCDYQRMDEHDQYESVGLDDSLEDERNLDETMAD